MLKNWINIFLYQIKNNKLFTALNILGLGIGIAGLIFAILYYNDENSYNNWNPEKDKVFQSIGDIGNGDVWPNFPAPLKTYLEKDPNVDCVMYTYNSYDESLILFDGKKQILDKIYNCENTFFKMFPFEFVDGSITSALKDENSTAISAETAKLLFGTEKAVGKQIQYENNLLIVRGVYNIRGKSSVAANMVINLMKQNLDENKDQWGNFNYNVLVKLKDVTKVESVINNVFKKFYDDRLARGAKELGITLEELKKKNDFAVKSILEPLSQARLHSIVDAYPEHRGNYQFLLILMGLSVLIMLLSIVNYVNLATANAVKRAKEVGVRKIIGASKSNIIKQFIFETILISSFSVFLALIIVELSLPYYNEFLEKNLVISGSQFYLQLALVFIITIVFAGILPAVYVSNFETLKVLKGNFGRSKSGVWLRNAMLIAQFAIATFFIVGSYIVYQQVTYLSNKDLGFSGSQVLQIRYRHPDIKFENNIKRGAILFNRYNTIKNELAKINGVTQVSNGVFTFGKRANSSSGFSYKDIDIQAENMAVDFGMLDMMKIKVIKGRDLNEKIASDTINSMLINETAVKMMKVKNPIGLEIDWNDQKLKIIGVVKDFNFFNPQDEIPPMSFFHMKTIDWMSFNMNSIYVKISKDNMEQTLAEIEKFWVKRVDQEYPFKYDFVDKSYARTYEQYVKQKSLFSLLNLVVILIALFGLFALASYSIQRRMKEIAIRKTLGAETNLLLKELSKQYIIFCLIGFLIALFPTYYLLNLWLENFSFRIDISILPFIIGFVVLLILTLVVVLSRAYQATKVDVLNYLKYE